MLGHVGLRPAGLARLEQRGRLAHHQLRRGGLGVCFRDGELDALVLPDRAAEHAAVVGVCHGAVDEEPGVAQRVGSDQYPFRVHAVEDIAEPPALLADQRIGRNAHIVEEELVGLVVYHGADRADLQPVAERLAHVHQEDGQPVGSLRHPVLGRGAREQQHEVGILRAARPDLLAVHHIAVALAHRGRAQAQRVRSAARFRDAECLEAQLARRDLRQVALLLLVVAVAEQRAHNVHLSVAGPGIAARGVDLLQHRASGGNRQTRAAVFLRDKHRQVAGVGQRLDEGLRIFAVAVELAPVVARIVRAEPAHRLADFRPGLADLHRDGARIVHRIHGVRRRLRSAVAPE